MAIWEYGNIGRCKGFTGMYTGLKRTYGSEKGTVYGVLQAISGYIRGMEKKMKFVT